MWHMKFLRLTSHHYYQQHLPSTPQMSTGSSWNLRLFFPSQWSRLQQRKRHRNHRWFSCRFIRFGSRQRYLGLTPWGWPQGLKLVPKVEDFFLGFSFCCFLGLGFVRRKGSKSSKQTISLCFFCLVVVVVAKGVDFLGEDFIQNKCRLLWRSGLKCLDVWPTPLKSNMTLEMEHHHLLIGDTSSNGCFSIVMLVFGGCTLIFVLRTQLYLFGSPPSHHDHQTIWQILVFLFSRSIPTPILVFWGIYDLIPDHWSSFSNPSKWLAEAVVGKMWGSGLGSRSFPPPKKNELILQV